MVLLRVICVLAVEPDPRFVVTCELAVPNTPVEASARVRQAILAERRITNPKVNDFRAQGAADIGIKKLGRKHC